LHFGEECVVQNKNGFQHSLIYKVQPAHSL
jgi:hypothetical protein